MIWHEEEHPRDSDGRFAETGQGTIIPGKGVRFQVPLDFFSERGLDSESPKSLRKGIVNIQKKLELHEEKLKNPRAYCQDWDTRSDAGKSGLIHYWNKEISAYKTAINDRIRRLKELGENIDEYDN